MSQTRTRREPASESSRPPRRMRRWLLPSILGVVTVVVLALYFTPVLGVRDVRVRGNTTLAGPRVIAAAAVPHGTSLLRLDTDQIQHRLRELPKVDSARVRLSWPNTVVLELTERVPVAFTNDNGRIRLVDATGMAFDVVQQPPRDLPEIDAARVAQDDPSTRSALTVLRALPASVRDQTETIVAESPRRIRLLLDGNRVVQWGDTDETPRKAAILPVLLTRPGTLYDVTSPALPTVTES